MNACTVQNDQRRKPSITGRPGESATNTPGSDEFTGRRAEVPGTTMPEASFQFRNLIGRKTMGKGIILWLLGVPGVVVIGLLAFHVI